MGGGECAEAARALARGGRLKLYWRTPDALFNTLNAEFDFTLDAAAQPSNARCPAYLTEEVNAINQPWPGRVWLSPPYDQSLDLWVGKAVQEATNNAEVVVALLPVYPDQKWWHWGVLEHALEIRFLPERIRYQPPRGYAGGEPGQVPDYMSAVVVFTKDGGPPMATTFQMEEQT